MHKIVKASVAACTLLTVLSLPIAYTWSAGVLTKISAVSDEGLKIMLNNTDSKLKNEDGSSMSPIIYNDRTYIPLRALSNLLGIGINYNADTRTINVSTDNKNIAVLSGVHMPNVSPEMNTPNYWINKTADAGKIILDANGVDGFNKKITAIRESKVYNLRDYPVFLSKDDLTNYISELPFPGEDRYIGDKKAEKSYYDEIRKNMNLSAIKSKNDILYGFTARRTNVRTLPVNDPSYTEPNDFEFDYFQETALEAAEPLLVLYKTLDNKWFFVQSSNYRGWTPSADIAVASKKEDWLSFLDDENFIVVTANKVTLAQNPYTPSLSGLTLGMGCKLPVFLSGEEPAYVDGMMSQGNYVVKIPARNEDGSLAIKNALVPFSNDISFGYLPYTKANVIKQAFKMSGDRYGWGGSFGSRDCSSFVCDIYKCFGIILPRNTTEQELSAGTTVKFGSQPYNERKKTIEGIEPCSIAYMPNHEMLYLGTVDGRDYIMHSVYSYGDKNRPKAGGGLEKVVINGIVVSDLDIAKRGNGKSFLENLTSIKTIK